MAKQAVWREREKERRCVCVRERRRLRQGDREIEGQCVWEREGERDRGTRRHTQRNGTECDERAREREKKGILRAWEKYLNFFLADFEFYIVNFGQRCIVHYNAAPAAWLILNLSWVSFMIACSALDASWQYLSFFRLVRSSHCLRMSSDCFPDSDSERKWVTLRATTLNSSQSSVPEPSLSFFSILLLAFPLAPARKRAGGKKLHADILSSDKCKF